MKTKIKIIGFKTYKKVLEYLKKHNLDKNKISMGFNKEDKFFIELLKEEFFIELLND
jgi:hypothetical protein